MYLGSKQSGILANLCRILFTYLLLAHSVTTMFEKNYPDALACTSGFVLNVTATTVYFLHAGEMFCQVYGPEERCVIFHANGTYRLGTGHLQSRLGCVNKTLLQLKEEGRWFQFASSKQITELNQKITKQNQRLEKMQNSLQALKLNSKQQVSEQTKGWRVFSIVSFVLSQLTTLIVLALIVVSIYRKCNNSYQSKTNETQVTC